MFKMIEEKKDPSVVFLESSPQKETHVVSSMKPAVLGQHFRESRGGISLKINHTTTKIVEGVHENSVQTSGLGQLQSSFSGCSDSFSSHGPFYDFSFILCLQPLWILNPVTIGAFLVPGPYDPHGTVSEIKVIATYIGAVFHYQGSGCCHI